MNTVIIDFDGTLADSFDQVLAFLMGQAGRDMTSLTEPERQSLKGLSMHDLALKVGVPRWKLIIVYFRGKAYLRTRMHNTMPFKGLEGVLSALHQENFKIMIVSSNSRRNITRFLSEHGMSGYFTAVYGNAGWFGKGPILKRVLKRYGIRPEDAVYVGDEVRDILGAQVAGMPSVGVTWGFGSEDQLLRLGPTILVRTPEQLQKALLDWGRPV